MFSWLYRIGLIPVIALTLATAAQALSSDRQQPMYVEADHADINDQTGVHVYTGNVTITQGTLHMTSDRLTLHTRDGEIVKAIGVGEPATYRQRPDNKDQDVHAEALRLQRERLPRLRAIGSRQWIQRQGLPGLAGPRSRRMCR